MSDEFAQDRQKQTQWQAFLRKNALIELQLSEVVVGLRAFLSPPLDALRRLRPEFEGFASQWADREGRQA